MENNPQAAYDSLCLYGKEMERGKSQKISMRYRLLMAKAQNKLFLAMPSDSAFQKVVDYYESKGTSNEKMEAHYLMGCIYRDQMEAPRAIQSFQEAADAYRQKKWERLNDKYLLLSNEMNQLVLKQNEIKDTYTNSIQQRQMKIESLQEEMQQYKEKIKAISKSERKFKMADHAVLAKFKQMEFSCGKKAVPSEEDWSELEHLFVSSFPLTYEIISKKKETLLLEFRVCMLTRFQFSNGGMANLLQSSPASISNAKSKANKRLFGDKGASTLYYNMVNCSLS